MARPRILRPASLVEADLFGRSVIKPARTLHRLGDQLAQLKEALPPELRHEWGAVLDRAVASLQNRGPKSENRDACIKWIAERLGPGEEPGPDLKRAASVHFMEPIDKVRRWWWRDRNNKRA